MHADPFKLNTLIIAQTVTTSKSSCSHYMYLHVYTCITYFIFGYMGYWRPFPWDPRAPAVSGAGHTRQLEMGNGLGTGLGSGLGTGLVVVLFIM